jgi:MATE family multidrug resistance protein
MFKALGNRNYDRAIWALALPALGSLAADPLLSLVDTAFIGRLGRTELGALGVNTAIFSLSFFIFNFLAYGTTPMIARSLGKNDKAQAGRIIMQAFTLATLLGLGALLLLELCAQLILSVMGASADLQGAALSYLRIRALAAPAVLFITAGNGVFRGFQNTRMPFVISLFLNFINLVLDPLFIFGFGWGLAGAAIATVLAQWLGALWFLWLIFFRQRDFFKLHIKLPKLAELRPFLKIGWELFLRTLSLSLAFTFATSVATRLGITQVAAHQVASQIWLLLALTIDALAIAAQALVAKYVGEGNTLEARAVANRLLFLGLIAGICFAILFFMFQGLLPRFFTSEPEIIALVLKIFPFVILTQPLNALVFVWDGIFIGAEDFGFLAFAMITASVLSGIVLSLVVPLNWGLMGVWWGISTLMLARVLGLGWRYQRLFKGLAR